MVCKLGVWIRSPQMGHNIYIRKPHPYCRGAVWQILVIRYCDYNFMTNIGAICRDLRSRSINIHDKRGVNTDKYATHFSVLWRRKTWNNGYCDYFVHFCYAPHWLAGWLAGCRRDVCPPDLKKTARAHPKMLPLIPNLSRPVPVVIRCAAFQFQFVTELVRSDLALIAYSTTEWLW